MFKKAEFITIFLMLFWVAISAQGIGINETGAEANANAILDVKSPATGDGKGILIPRITEAQRTSADANLAGGLLDGSGNLRGGVAQGLLIYQTDGTEGFYYNKSITITPEWIYLGIGENSVKNADIESLDATKITGTIPLSHGGTGGITAEVAKTNLGLKDVKLDYADEACKINIGNTNAYTGENNIAIGFNAKAGVGTHNGVTGIAGIAIGAQTTARYARGGDECPYSLNSIAIGTESDGDYGGIAIGYDADGQYRNIAIGHKASAYSGYNRISIGNGVVNRINNSIVLRGTLFLEDCEEMTIGGQTGRIFYRSGGDPTGETDFDGGAWTAKAFTIDHPLDPKNKVLRHFCMEGPDVLNVYTGNIVITNGEAKVELPDYYSALNLVSSEVYSLTAIGGPAQIWIKKKVSDNSFIIGADSDVEVSWTVKVKRNDKSLLKDLKNRPVEQSKHLSTPDQRMRENAQENTFDVNN
jgi:hypothetical protein